MDSLNQPTNWMQSFTTMSELWWLVLKICVMVEVKKTTKNNPSSSSYVKCVVLYFEGMFD